MPADSCAMRKRCMLASRCTLVICFSFFATLAQGADQSNRTEALNQQMIKLTDAGNFADALPIAKELLTLVEKTSGQQSTNAAACWNDLAVIYQATARYAESEEAFKRAASVLEKIESSAPTQMAEVLAGLGSLYMRTGKSKEAETTLQRALQCRLKDPSPDDPLLATCHDQLGWLFSARGDFTQAELHYQKALEIREKTLGPKDRGTAFSLENLALLNLELGDYAGAEQRYLQARKIMEENLPTHPDIARCYDGLGRLYNRMGEYSKAEEFYLRALAIRDSGTNADIGLLASTLNNVGTFYQGIGDYATAEPLLLRSLGIKKRLLEPGHPGLAVAYQNLGLLYAQEKKADLAESNFLSAIEIIEKAPNANPADLAHYIGSLGGVHHERRNYVRAEKAYLRALAIQEQVFPPESEPLTAMLHNLARLYQDMGDTARAEQYFLRALRIHEQALGPLHRETAKTMECLSRLKIETGDPAEALQFALRTAPPNAAALANILSFGTERQRLGFLRDKDSYSLLATLGSTGPLATTLLRNKGIILDSLIEDRQVAATGDPAVRLLSSRLRSTRQQIAQMDSVVRKVGDTEAEHLRAAERERLSAEAERMESSLARQVAGQGKSRRALSVTVEQVQQALPKKSVLLEFVRYTHFLGKGDKKENRYGTIVLTDIGHPTWASLGPSDAIEKNVRLFQHFMRSKPDEAALTDLLHALHEQLWSPIEKVLPRGTRTVIISPDAELNFLSFATLLNSSNRFVGSDYSISYVASGRDLLATNTSSAADQRLAIYANPDFGMSVDIAAASKPDISRMRTAELRGFRDMTFRLLPGAEKEARLLETKAGKLGFQNVALRLGKQATEAELNRLESPHVLHLATHGFFLPDTDSALTPGPNRSDSASTALPSGARVNPMRRSGLALSGAQRTLAAWADGQSTSAENDGIVSAEEVGGLNLRNTWLVVLSACDTGAGEARAGEGVLGLRRGFVRAGAQNLLLTLWPIDDEQTTDLILDFYAEAARSGDAPTALAEVQGRWLDQLRRKKGLLEACRLAGPFILSFRGAVR